MGLNVDTSNRLSARVLRYIADKGPQTVAGIMAGLDLPATERSTVESIVRNFRNRGKLTGTRLVEQSGRPTVYAIVPEVAEALDAIPAGERPWRQGPRPGSRRARRRKRTELTPDQRRWTGYFLRAGWPRMTVARYFGLKARDLDQ